MSAIAKNGANVPFLPLSYRFPDLFVAELLLVVNFNRRCDCSNLVNRYVHAFHDANHYIIFR